MESARISTFCRLYKTQMSIKNVMLIFFPKDIVNIILDYSRDFNMSLAKTFSSFEMISCVKADEKGVYVFTCDWNLWVYHHTSCDLETRNVETIKLEPYFGEYFTVCGGYCFLFSRNERRVIKTSLAESTPTWDPATQGAVVCNRGHVYSLTPNGLQLLFTVRTFEGKLLSARWNHNIYLVSWNRDTHIRCYHSDGKVLFQICLDTEDIIENIYADANFLYVHKIKKHRCLGELRLFNHIGEHLQTFDLDCFVPQLADSLAKKLWTSSNHQLVVANGVVYQIKEYAKCVWPLVLELGAAANRWRDSFC